jgi:Xaa-Pro aminopeptidase
MAPNPTRPAGDLPSADPEARRRKLREAVRDARLDGFLVVAPPNVRYLTGFTGSNAILLAAGSAEILLTDPRYRTQAAEQVSCPVEVVRGPLLPAAIRLIRTQRLRKLGFEKSKVDVGTFQELEEAVESRTRLLAVNGLVEKLRAIKSRSEVDLIRRSVRTCSEAYRRAVRKIRPGLREFELAAEIDYLMRRQGADRPAFDTIVAAGRRSALPHARPTHNALINNQLLLVDMGAEQDGYASDMTRMIHLGKPSTRARQLHRAVLDAQLEGIAAVRAGVPAATVDQRTRKTLRSHGLERFFVHSTGHGLGLEIHEFPRLGRGEPACLEAGMVVTIEPGVYFEGFGGIRIEDTVLVTQSGCEVLTPTPKDLLVL